MPRIAHYPQRLAIVAAATLAGSSAMRTFGLVAVLIVPVQAGHLDTPGWNAGSPSSIRVGGYGYSQYYGFSTVFNAAPEFQVADSAPLLGGQGQRQALGGMFSGVLPSVAYLGITDGSRISLTPPTEGPPLGGDWTSSISFHSEIPSVYYFPDGATLNDPVEQIYLGMQYHVTGYLAPGAEMSVDFGARAWTNFHIRAELRDIYTRTESGEFSYSFEAWTPLNSRYYAFVTDDWRLVLDATLYITDAEGPESSWAVLDPGISTGTDPNNLFPWVPAANPVPEPASWLLGLIGMAGVPLMRRRMRINVG